MARSYRVVAPVSAFDPPRIRYAERHELGRGGMGHVVEAVDLALGRCVAIKRAHTRERVLLRRFEREVRITARLQHPAIMPVHDAGRVVERQPDRSDWQRDLVFSQYRIAVARERQRGQRSALRAALARALATAAAAAERFPQVEAIQLDHARIRMYAGDERAHAGDPGAARAEYRAALSIARRRAARPGARAAREDLVTHLEAKLAARRR